MPSKFDLQRVKLAEGLSDVADSMRKCAQLAESFAKVVEDSLDADDHNASEHADDSTKGKLKVSLAHEDGDARKKRKRISKPKDPNAPKRPASSYILFQNQVRKELKELNPKLSNADLLAMISEQWKKLSDEQKETYNQLVKQAKVQYSEEKKAYDNRTPEQIEAANAAAVAAAIAKKANAKPRGPKPVIVAVPARSSEPSSGEDDSDEEESPKSKHVEPDSDEEDEEDEELEEEPVPKKRRKSRSPQPVQQHKAKKA